MVLICAPLSMRVLQLSPLIFTLATFLPVPMLKGVCIQEGSLLGSCYALETSSWGFLGIAVFIWRVWAPFLDAIPSLQFNWVFSLKALTSGQLQIKCLGLLHWKQCFSSTWASFTALTRCTMNISITPLILSGSSLSTSSSFLVLSFSKCVRHMVAILGTSWFPLSFCKGKKLVVYGLAVLSTASLHGFQDNSIESSFSTSPAAQR